MDASDDQVRKVRAVRDAALATLLPFADPANRGALPAMTDALRPAEPDYARVFVPDVAEVAQLRYAVAWAAAPVIDPSPQQVELRVHVAPAALLTSENDLSREFPAGYRRIAHLLLPDRLWVRWRYMAPGQAAGAAYDGLVWLDDHFAWFPKPWRFLVARD